MAEDQQTTFEGAKYAGTLRIKAGAASTGGQSKIPKGAVVAFVGRGPVDSVTFATKSGMPVREHTAKPDELVMVPEDIVRDVLDELREAETGQARLLSDEGEVRRAGRAVTRARALVVAEGNQDDSAVESPLEFQERLEGHWTTLAGIVDDVDAYPDVETYWMSVEDELQFAAATLLAGVEWAHRQRHQVIEDKRLAAEVAEMEAEQAERDAARAAGEAAAVSSDDVADSEAAKLNQDDGAIPAYDPDDDPDDVSSITGELDPDDEQGDDAPPAEEAAMHEVDPFEDAPEDDDGYVDPALAETPKPATEQQRVAISRHLMAASDTPRLAAEWAEWCAGHSIPQTPAEMTFEQARKALVFLGDAANAEAGG